MSLASSAASEISVAFDGEVCSLEQAIDKVMRGTQQKLNDLATALRNLAQFQDQGWPCEDPDDEFKHGCELDWQTKDLISGPDGLIGMLNELPKISKDLRGPVPKELKPWFTQKEAQRKEEAAKVVAAKKEEAAAAKQAAKEANATR